MKVKFTHKRIGEDIYEITAPMQEKIYLVIGKEKALVIDTGTGIGRFRSIVESITPLPIIVVNTHGHPDHCGGNYEFDECYLPKEDLDLYRDMCSLQFRSSDLVKILGEEGKQLAKYLIPFYEKVIPFEIGKSFQLGDRLIKTYPLAGHTKGSCLLYDENTSSIFVGDAISLKDTWLFLDCATSLETYKNQLENFLSNNLKIDHLYSGHYPNVADGTLFSDRLTALNNILSGKAEGESCKTFAGDGLRYEYKGSSFIYKKEKIFS